MCKKDDSGKNIHRKDTRRIRIKKTAMNAIHDGLKKKNEASFTKKREAYSPHHIQPYAIRCPHAIGETRCFD